MIEPTPLDTVLAYRNDRVLLLYEQNRPDHTLRAAQAFPEVLKYLWLTMTHAKEHRERPTDPTLPRRCLMLRSMREIDDMWHEFILFTRDYNDFCMQYFGEFVHHLPNVFDNLPMTDENTDAEITKLIAYVYDKLGEQTVRTWFAAYLAEPAAPPAGNPRQ